MNRWGQTRDPIHRIFQKPGAAGTWYYTRRYFEDDARVMYRSRMRDGEPMRATVIAAYRSGHGRISYTVKLANGRHDLAFLEELVPPAATVKDQPAG